MTYGKNNPLTINGVNYPIAVSDKGIEWGVTERGDILEKIYKDLSGGMGYTFDTDEAKNGFWTANPCDTTTPGRIRKAPKHTSTASRDAANTNYAYAFEVSDGSTTYVYIVQGSKAHKYSFDGATRHETLTFAGTAGRPVYWQGAWYVPFGDGNSAKKLTVPVNTPPTSDSAKWASVSGSWEAIALCTFQEGTTAKVVRVYGTNKIAKAASTGAIGSGDWTDAATIGDTSAACTDVIEAQGMVYVAKTDNLYEFDTDSVARPVLPGMNRGTADANNGKGLYAFGDIIFFPATNGLWRYRIGSGAIPVGPDAIRQYTNAAATPSSGIPIQYRHFCVVSDGEWLYSEYNNSPTDNASFILAGRFRQENEPRGHEVIWHTIGLTLASRGMYVDSAHKLWILTTAGGFNSGPTIFQLGQDGSVESSARDTGTAYEVYLPETDLGYPFRAKELVDMSVDVATNGVVSLELRVMQDGGGETDVSASTISSSGRQSESWNAQSYAFKVRPIIKMNSTHTADVYALRLRFRRPSVYTLLVPCDNDALHAMGLEEQQVLNNLRSLVDAGPHTILEPDKELDSSGTPVDVTWSGFVESVTHTTYRSQNGAMSRAIEVKISRFAPRVAV